MRPPDPARLARLQAALAAHAPSAHRHGVLAFGHAGVDACLGGGLALGCLHELTAEGIEAETGTVAAGFAACLLAALLRQIPGTRPVFWIAPRSGGGAPALHPPGLLAYGLDPGRVVMVETSNTAATLETMEAVLRAGAASAVVAEAERLERTRSRRLQLACLGKGTTGFVLRRHPWGRAGADRDTSMAVTRWRLAPAPSAAAFREPGPPRWLVELLHARGGTEGAWIMEAMGGTDAPHALRVVAALADSALTQGGAPAAPARRHSA
jgi:protein ImuA